MTAAAPRSFRSVSPKASARTQYGDRSVKNLARNAEVAAKRPRRWFRDLLWRAFPSASERELAEVAAPVLGVSKRQVQNWLREENDASVSSVLKVLAIVGAEVVFVRDAA